MVKVEIAPGQFVKCHAGDEQIVAAKFAAGSVDMPVVDSNSFKNVNDKTNAGKGPLIRVQIAPNRVVKMYEADAVAQGYLKKKAEPPKENKGRPSQGNKGAGEGESAPEAEVQQEADATGESTAADDLTTITGIGKATERLINAHGISTFEQLRSADLSFLTTQAQQAVEDWKQNG
jgi:predicted flap endonuclease-1-like 5' DNA nuclease